MERLPWGVAVCRPKLGLSLFESLVPRRTCVGGCKAAGRRRPRWVAPIRGLKLAWSRGLARCGSWVGGLLQFKFATCDLRD
jgi:hypothetical protein